MEEKQPLLELPTKAQRKEPKIPPFPFLPLPNPAGNQLMQELQKHSLLRSASVTQSRKTLLNPRQFFHLVHRKIRKEFLKCPGEVQIHNLNSL